ncbi:MAG: hypothetical protein K0R23_224 [Lacrimispora sp.]|nr:hypothetical protein [Lacrimispora sp.]
MDKKTVYDLAIAYAQAKLIKYQQDNPEENGHDSELRAFVKSYNYALQQIPIEYEDMD